MGNGSEETAATDIQTHILNWMRSHPEDARAVVASFLTGLSLLETCHQRWTSEDTLRQRLIQYMLMAQGRNRTLAFVLAYAVCDHQFEPRSESAHEALLAHPLVQRYAKEHPTSADPHSQEIRQTLVIETPSLTWNWQSIVNYLEFCNVTPDNLTAFAPGVSALTTDGRHIEAIVFRDCGPSGFQAIVPAVTPEVEACRPLASIHVATTGDTYAYPQSVARIVNDRGPLCDAKVEYDASTDARTKTPPVVDAPDDEHAAMERFFFGR